MYNVAVRRFSKTNRVEVQAIGRAMREGADGSCVGAVRGPNVMGGVHAREAAQKSELFSWTEKHTANVVQIQRAVSYLFTKYYVYFFSDDKAENCCTVSGIGLCSCGRFASFV